MQIEKLLALIICSSATLTAALPAMAQVPWDMVPTQQVAPEYQQPQFQSPINPAALAGYSIAAPQNTGGINPASFSSAQSALNSGGATGGLGNTTMRTNGFGVNPTQTMNHTHNQNQSGLRLPQAGTMGLAPVFGTGNDGFTSPGGYAPPMINIPGVGSYRIPQTIGLPGGSSLQVPTQQLLQETGL